MPEKKLLIIDANSIINRAFYGIRLLTTKDGTFTNAVYGFLNIFYKYKEEIKPDYIAAAFDLKAPTFRHKMFDGYKATRHPMPEELVPQLPLLKEVLRALGIPILEKEGYEADDIIGTVAARCTKEDIACMILTGDKDDLQLATEHNKIYLITTRMGNTETEIFDAQHVFEKYGVTPQEFIDVKAIMGDTSDNIPGIKGIGEKGALSLISAFKSLDAIYENLDADGITKSMRTKLAEGRESAYLSRTLATINCEVPILLDLEAARESEGDIEALRALYTRLEFKSFLKKLPTSSGSEPAPDSAALQYETVAFSTQEALAEFLQKDVLYYLPEEGSNRICITDGSGKVAMVPLTEPYLTVIKGFLKEAKGLKVTHGAKEQYLWAESMGLTLSGRLFDTAIAAYLLDPARRSYALLELCRDFLQLSFREETVGEQLSFDAEPAAESTACIEKTAALPQLYQALSDRLAAEEMQSLFQDIEMPLVEVLAAMQKEGILVDKARLLEFGDMLDGQISGLTEDIYTLAGETFNINSPKQLGVILYEKLGLKSSKKTKTGYSTNAEALEKLVDAHPIIEKILEFRQLSKLKSTYVDGLKDVIDHRTGRIHSNFHQTVTVTGRISSSEPNLQNIPVRTTLGREMRKMFVAAPGHVLIDADYSQIELRVLAHIAGDEAMIASFAAGKDIHASTAAKLFGVSEDAVDVEKRTAAKAINFGLIYGKGEFSLARDLGISIKEAKAYMEEYLGSFPKVRDYMKSIVEFAKAHGYVSTMFGRRRHLPELKSSNFQLRAFGERAALNAPIQGTAADIIKLAMVRVYHRLQEEKLTARLILQVHDELIVEAPEQEAEKAQKILREEMEQAVALSVPLFVDMQTGKSWYDTK
ncbi:MAG: DNA polymerase I [Ruminococcaceae bacterium]|nr:DNA polymerase I [Oscillospiraceae bacterium]